MKDVLEEQRTILIGGRPEVYPNYARLRDRAEGLIEAIERIEATIPVGEIGTGTAWKDIGDLIGNLAEVVTAQNQWLADNDASILRDIETLRRDLRNLKGSGPMAKEEG